MVELVRVLNMKTKIFSQEGFSLIELLVVVVIGIILASVAIFSIVGTRRNLKTVTTANLIASFMQQARQTAIATRRYQKVTLQRNADSSGKINSITISAPPTPTAAEVVLRKEYLAQDVVLGRPTNVAIPTAAVPKPEEDAFLKTPFSPGNIVTLYFNIDGSVTSGDAFPQTASSPFSGSIFVADAPSGPGTNSPSPELTRVVTISAPTGGIKFWSYTAGQFQSGIKNF